MKTRMLAAARRIRAWLDAPEEPLARDIEEARLLLIAVGLGATALFVTATVPGLVRAASIFAGGFGVLALVAGLGGDRVLFWRLARGAAFFVPLPPVVLAVRTSVTWALDDPVGHWDTILGAGLGIVGPATAIVVAWQRKLREADRG
jgi:hypothetical protein